MKKTILIISITGVLAVIFSGCAQDNYNSYDNRSNYDRKMDYAAQDAVYDASKNLSAQDMKNLNNLK